MQKPLRTSVQALYLCGPSGVGKSSVSSWLEARSRFRRVRPVVTRDRRGSESNGKDAWFCSQEEFQRLEDSSLLIEPSTHNNARYAYLRQEIQATLREGSIPLYDFYAPRLQPFRSDRHAVYLLPDSTKWLLQRIAARGGVPPAEVRARMKFVHDELQWVVAEGRGVIDEFVPVTAQMSVNLVGQAVLASIQKREWSTQLSASE